MKTTCHSELMVVKRNDQPGGDERRAIMPNAIH
jgi:hypothetical protein